jgi:urease accessory protein
MLNPISGSIRGHIKALGELISMLRFSYLVFATLLMLTPALAHTGIGETTGLAVGFSHPVGGMDHVLAMVAVGLLAALLGGRALWFVPASFVAMMAVGGALGMAGVGIPFVELGIGLSVVVLGAVVAFSANMRLAAAMTIAGLFAIFHGHAHGVEIPDTASGFEYAIGFVLAAALLHAAGIALGLAIGRMSDIGGRRVARLTGGGMTLAGVALLAAAI